MLTRSYYSGQRLSITPRSITSTPTYEGGNWVRSHAQRLAEVNLKDNTHKGQLSKKSTTKLFNAVNWLVQSAAWKRLYSKADQKYYFFKINFITLTIPQQEHGDVNGVVLQKLLHNFLVYARKYFHLRNYVWKVERGKQGKIHIHLTSDTFIHYKKLRQCWNTIMQKEGLVDDYFNKTGHYNPNSTDVHATKKIKNIAGYMCKYMSKETGLDENYKNRIWGCNSELSHTNRCTLLLTPDEVEKECRCLFNNPIESIEIFGKPKPDGSRSFLGMFFKVDEQCWNSFIKGKLLSAYNKHRSMIRSNSSTAPDDYLVIEDYASILVPPVMPLAAPPSAACYKTSIVEQGLLNFN